MKRHNKENAPESDDFFIHALMEHIPDSIYFKDLHGRFLKINRAQAELLGVDAPNEAIGKTDFDFFESTEAEEMYSDEERVIHTGEPMIGKIEAITTGSGSTRWFSVTKVPLYNENDEIIGSFGLSRDITDRKQLEDERESLIKKLKDALDKVHTLRGLIPICYHCKRIRDDKGYWHEVEMYVKDHSEAEFSHGLCEVCAKEYYPEYSEH